MDHIADPSRISIDDLIQWVRSQRQHNRTAKLSDLLSGHKVHNDRLVDVACIDLMHRRRLGDKTTVEDYVDEFSELGSESHVLDLIDAEICVAQELGQPVSVEDYVKRFPKYGDAIGELVQLDIVPPVAMASAIIGLGDSRRVSDDSTEGSAEFSVAPMPEIHDGKMEIAFPVELPEWFVPEESIACSPGRWLFRGREVDRGDKLALKVIELPAQISGEQQQKLLDACETASKVRNRHWIAPTVAAIQNRRLAIVRPWVFAQPWHRGDESIPRSTQLRTIASVAFALQSAHDSGATHGGLHAGNVLISHDGKPQILDAICNLEGANRWIREVSELPEPDALATSIQTDIQALIKLVAVAAVGWDDPWAGRIAAELQAIETQFPGQAGGRIGEHLIRLADTDRLPSGATPPTTRGAWKGKVRQWFGGS